MVRLKDAASAPPSASVGRPPETIPVPVGISRRRPAIRGRYRVALVVVALLGGVHLVDDEAIGNAVDAVVERVKRPVQSLEGEAHLRAATTALSGAWAQHGSYHLDEAELRAVDPSVPWGEGITLVPCHHGAGAVLVADTVRGHVSRLLVRGDDVGDLSGSHPCPESLADRAPWPN